VGFLWALSSARRYAQPRRQYTKVSAYKKTDN
jgi:hypothetical protein